jgi:hypothetical protein
MAWLNRSHTTTDSKALLSTLKALPPDKLFNPIKKALADKSTKSEAIELVGKLEHPRALDLLQGLIRDEAHCKRVADILLATDSEDAEAALCEAWGKEPTDKPVFTIITERLSRHLLSCKHISYFTDQALSADSKHLHARRVVAKSLRLTPACTNEELSDARRKYVQLSKDRARPLDVPARATPLKIRGGRRWDANREFNSTEWLRFPVPEWTSNRDHRLVIQFYPLGNDDCSVGYSSTEGMWNVTMQGGEGVIVPGNQEEYHTLARSHQWNRFEIQVSVHDIPDVKSKSRTVAMLVNDYPIEYDGTFNGDITGMFLSGHCIIGGCYVENL